MDHSLSAWLSACCVTGPGRSCPRALLHRSYLAYRGAAWEIAGKGAGGRPELGSVGGFGRTLSKYDFAAALREAGVTMTRSAGGWDVQGIDLIDTATRVGGSLTEWLRTLDRGMECSLGADEGYAAYAAYAVAAGCAPISVTRWKQSMGREYVTRKGRYLGINLPFVG